MDTPARPSKQKRHWRQLRLALSWPKDRHVLALPEHVAFESGGILQRVELRLMEGSWRVMVKATIKGKPVVAFTGAAHFDDALEALLWEASVGALQWKPDKWP